MRGECVADPSVFPTALMAHALSYAPEATAVRDRALAFLKTQMDERGLWRHWTREHPFHDQLPPDLDDTSMASAALGANAPANRQLLLANRNRRGLFFTWVTPARLWLRHPLTLFLFFRKTSAKPSDVDAVVNANVLSYLGDIEETRAVVAHLLHVLRTNGERTCDKWYERPFAVWYFFSRALRGIAPEAGTIIAGRIAAARPESALDHALAACSLLDWDRTPSDDTIAALLEAQLPSGGWPRAGLYHGGRARLGPNAFAAPHPDTPWWGSEELTTAFCIEALARYQARR